MSLQVKKTWGRWDGHKKLNRDCLANLLVYYGHPPYLGSFFYPEYDIISDGSLRDHISIIVIYDFFYFIKLVIFQYELEGLSLG